MSLADDLQNLYAKLQTALNNANAEIVSKGGSEADDIYGLSDKINSITLYKDEIIGLLDTRKLISIIDVPEEVTRIRPYAFYGSYAPITVNLSSKTRVILDYAFVDNSSTSNVHLGCKDTIMFDTSFYNCTKITNITVCEDYYGNIYFHRISFGFFADACLHGIIENLRNVSSESATYLFKVGGTNLSKIDEEHINMLIEKGWTYE